jgi:hypothetical protein
VNAKKPSDEAKQFAHEFSKAMKGEDELGVISADLQQPLNALDRLRNKFAQRLVMKLTDEDANNFYNTFSKPSGIQ